MPKPTVHVSPADTSQAVDAFMAQLQHPCKEEIRAIRAAILAADASVQEGIKWNAPSFRTTEYFATMHLRAKVGVTVILHLGAKARALPAGGVAIDDPAALLKWLAPDRAAVQFDDLAAVDARCLEFQALLRQWLKYV